MNLAQLLEFGDDEETGAPKILPEAAVARLRERAALYRQTNRFKVGDLVTPHADGFLYGAGEPHIVIELNDAAEPRYEGNAGDPIFGARYDVRIMGFGLAGNLSTWWVESHQLAPWTDPSAETGTNA